MRLNKIWENILAADWLCLLAEELSIANKQEMIKIHNIRISDILVSKDIHLDELLVMCRT